MTTQIYWLDNTKSTLVFKVPHYWDWSEMAEWNTQIKHALDNHTQDVTIIVDYQQSTYVPQNIVTNFHRMVTNKHPRTKSIILTGLTGAHESIWSTMFQLYPNMKKLITITENPYKLAI